MGTRIARKLIRAADCAVDFATFCLIVLVLLFGLYALWDSRDVYAAADAVNYAQYRPEADNTVSFQELMKKNREIVAWLNVYGTHIDYPVVHYSDNVKYLNTDAFGEYNLAGALFLDCDNAGDFSDFNSIIFGHHMDRKEMFGELTDFSERAFFDAHETGNLWYGGRGHRVVWFAYIEANAYDADLYTPAVKGEERQKYLDRILHQAKYTREAGVSADTRILLLSTCSSYETNGRAVLVGRITDDEPAEQ